MKRKGPTCVRGRKGEGSECKIDMGVNSLAFSHTKAGLAFSTTGSTFSTFCCPSSTPPASNLLLLLLVSRKLLLLLHAPSRCYN
ncbi:hypothetical protein BRADI_2g46486v3 [Brachypodium distachyon]|nr:hypothetical protein BRADI_2g46486v3 [Brachypodium distachyon]